MPPEETTDAMSDTTTTGAMPALRDAIEFYRRHGHVGPYAIKGGESNPPVGDPPKPDPKPDPDAALGLGDAGKAALKAEREARATAEKAAKDAASELATLRKEKSEAAAAKAAADEEEAKRKGEFETLAARRKEEADAAKADAEAKGSKLTRAEVLLKSVITDRLKVIEETGDKELLAAFPKDAEPLEQIEWLDDPRTKAALKVAGETKKIADANVKPKTPRTPNPDPNANGKTVDEEARAAMARNYRDW